MVRALLLLCALSSVAHADVGAMVDAGVPSGAGASLIYRPRAAVALHVGVAHNGVAPGGEAGLTLAPFGHAVRPTLTLEAGRFGAGDANPAFERVLGEPSAIAPERFGYDYANAHVGIELGTRRFAWYLRGGVSYVRASMSTNDTSDDGATTTMSDVAVRAVTPSARTGFIFYFGS